MDIEGLASADGPSLRRSENNRSVDRSTWRAGAESDAAGTDGKRTEDALIERDRSGRRIQEVDSGDREVLVQRGRDCRGSGVRRAEVDRIAGVGGELRVDGTGGIRRPVGIGGASPGIPGSADIAGPIEIAGGAGGDGQRDSG